MKAMEEIIAVAVLVMFGFMVGLSYEQSTDKYLTPTKAEILCEYSQWATDKYKIINGSIYCQESVNGYQRLRKPEQKEIKK